MDTPQALARPLPARALWARILAGARAVRPAARRALALPEVRCAWTALWSSRIVVFLAGVLGVLSLGRAPGSAGFDPARLTAPYGYLGNLLAAPFARWDSVWYLSIAQGGYAGQRARTAFFPVYPLLVRWLGWLTTDVVAGILVSLVSLAVALVLLHRLAALEIGRDAAPVCVLLMAFCPVAFFLSAVYSESLFLALSLGCILSARSGRWAWAGVLGGLAAAERATGITLVVPLVLMFLYGPRSDRVATWHRPGDMRWQRLLPIHRPTASLAWILLVPAGLGAFLAGLALSQGDGLAPLHAGSLWYRHFAGPFGGVWDGARAAWDGLRQLIHGPPPPVYFTQAGGDPLVVAEQNLVLFGSLVVGGIALVGAFRRLPFAYGAYALASLAMPLSYPVGPQPLQSIPRYELVLFPLFMWAAWWVAKRRVTAPAVAACAVLLGLFTAQFASWRFVA